MPVPGPPRAPPDGSTERRDRKSTRLNSSHTEIYTLSLHDALPISRRFCSMSLNMASNTAWPNAGPGSASRSTRWINRKARSEEHTSELQSHRDLHSFPTRRSSDLAQILLHVAEHGVEYRLAQCRSRVRLALHPMDQQKG